MKEYIVNRFQWWITRILMFDSNQERSNYINNLKNKISNKPTIYQYENTQWKTNFCLELPVFVKKKNNW